MQLLLLYEDRIIKTFNQQPYLFDKFLAQVSRPSAYESDFFSNMQHATEAEMV